MFPYCADYVVLSVNFVIRLSFLNREYMSKSTRVSVYLYVTVDVTVSGTHWPK